MKYTTFKTNSKYPEVNKWFDDRLFGEAQSAKEWLTCWVRRFQGLCGREKVGDKTYWVFILKDRQKFIKNSLTWRDEIVECDYESSQKT